MVNVKFLGPIARSDLNLDIKNLRNLKEILQNDDNLKPWLEICAVCVNDEIVNNLDLELKDGDKIAILPPVCGG